MNMTEELTLIAQSIPAGSEQTNAHGFDNTPTPTQTNVFAEQKDVGYSEFYAAAAAGYKNELKFNVHTEEYDGQRIVLYNARRYKVLRTYRPKEYGGEITELTLTDLPEGGA
jgi:SPP1 family predicted phage head-tail adaptor